LARAIGAADKGAGDNEAAAAFLDALEFLCAEVAIPTLAAYGVPREPFFAAMDKMAVDALASGSPANNPRLATREEIIDLYYKVL
jgi:alcohol dehydrogenase class IV